MDPAVRILLIEDDAGIVSALQRVLTDEGHCVATEARGDTGLRCAQKDNFDVVITDLKMPGLSGLDLVRQLHTAKPLLPIILVTAHGTTETAIEATKAGAYDYLLKPFEMAELLQLVTKAVTHSRTISTLPGLGIPGTKGDTLVGKSRAMQDIFKEIGRIAAKPVNVLLRGETGTGKELIARAIYHHSDRSAGPFVAINCAAIPEALLESELFGHERGAFTGAEARRIGRFEQAHRGTIFLDEIGDMSPITQVKLLRVLQEKCLQRLGGKETIPVDVRIIAATHRNLEAAMQKGQFREDLFYRLSVVVIAVAPLRDRREDVPELIHYFLRKYGAELGSISSSIHPEAVECLQNQPWPGNVRELENAVRKALLLARGYTINTDHVRAALAPINPSATRSSEQSLRQQVAGLLAAAQRGELDDAHARLLNSTERELFSQAIQLARGNQAKAARWLGVSRLTMREKLNQFGLHPAQDKAVEETCG